MAIPNFRVQARERESPRAVFSNFYDGRHYLALFQFLFSPSVFSSAPRHFAYFIINLFAEWIFIFRRGEGKGVRFNEIKPAFHF